MILCIELNYLLKRSMKCFQGSRDIKIHTQRSKMRLSGKHSFSYKELLQWQAIMTFETCTSQIITRGRLCKYWRNRSRWYRNSQWLIIWKHWWRRRWRQREVHSYRTLWRRKWRIKNRHHTTETKILKDSLHPHQTL